MTTTPLAAWNSRLESGLRPFELHRDLHQVAELVGEAFATELDAASQMALRDMRVWGRFFQGLGFGYLNSFNSFNLLDGFVWTDASRVVGNVSLQKLDPFGRRWQIANMAVARSHQRQGIAKELLRRALAYLREVGAQYAVLQVRGSNHVAQRLYARYGFERMGGSAELKGRTPLATRAPSAASAVQPIAGREWRKIYDLAQGQMERHMKWWHPLKRGDFVHDWPQQLTENLSFLIGWRQVQRFGIRYNAGHLATAAIVDSQFWKGLHQISLWSRPQLYGRYEQDLVDALAQTLDARPGCRVQAKVDADHKEAIAALRACGLDEIEVLDTMRCALGNRRSR